MGEQERRSRLRAKSAGRGLQEIAEIVKIAGIATIENRLVTTKDKEHKD